MFTVRHIHTSGGDALYLASEVTFIPSPAASALLTRSPIEAAHAGGMVNIIRESGILLGLSGGTVEVLNDKGTVVQIYEIGEPVAYFSDTRLMSAGRAGPPGFPGEPHPAHFDNYCPA